jgi:hypothetical protein
LWAIFGDVLWTSPSGGSGWARVELPPHVRLRQLGGSGPNDVWLSDEKGALFHSDGGAWCRMVLPATPDHAGAHFVVAGPRELWAWGFSKKGISAEEAATIASILDVDPKQMKPSEMTTDVLLHWDGTAFRIEEPPTHITGMAGGKGTLFALGMNGTILRKSR